MCMWINRSVDDCIWLRLIFTAKQKTACCKERKCINSQPSTLAKSINGMEWNWNNRHSLKTDSLVRASNWLPGVWIYNGFVSAHLLIAVFKFEEYNFSSHRILVFEMTNYHSGILIPRSFWIKSFSFHVFTWLSQEIIISAWNFSEGRMRVRIYDIRSVTLSSFGAHAFLVNAFACQLFPLRARPISTRVRMHAPVKLSNAVRCSATTDER